MKALRRLAPLLLDEPDQQRLAFNVRRICISNGLALLVWALVAAAVLQRPRNALLGGVAAAGLFGLAALARSRPIGAGAGVSAWIWTMGLLSQLAAGGMAAISTAPYLIAIASAGLLLGIRPAILTSLLTAVVSGGAALAGEAGMLSSLLPPTTRVGMWWFSLTGIVAMPILMSEVLTRMRATLHQVQGVERRYRLVAENSRDLIWLIENGELRYVSPASERLLGFTPEEQIARGVSRLFLTPDSAQIAQSAFARAVSDGERFIRYEAEHVRKDGSTVMCEVDVSLIRDSGGDVRAVLGVTRDISERRRAERDRELLSAELIQAQKMEVVGRFAACVAHDLNNQLTVILGSIEVMADLPQHLRAEAHKDIEEAAQSAAALTRQLQLFSRRGHRTPTRFDLNGMVRRLQRTLARILGVDIEVVVGLAPVPAVVFADEQQVEQALLNLVMNARDAMPAGGRLGIDVAAVESPSACWRLSVSDTGTGIDEASKPHVFEAFFTTKPPELGTGLGLSMVRRVVEESGGRVSFESALGKGTTFHVDLPRHLGSASEARDEEADDSSKGEQATVLVVDDSAEVRELLTRAISAAGHRVLQAASAAQAISQIRGDPLDLLVTDIAMPGTRGPQLAALLRSSRPRLRVLYVTGYASDDLELAKDPLSAVLWKPFGMKQLRNAVRRALDAAADERLE
ncbi:MAG: PAS domain S-box protein [Deltaproteobacteria bacterium]|nr:PAS domain S-box protein [Deltaproteobacteria bacterium]